MCAENIFFVELWSNIIKKCRKKIISDKYICNIYYICITVKNNKLTATRNFMKSIYINKKRGGYCEYCFFIASFSGELL